MCREAVAAGIIQITKDGTGTNSADLFTKILSNYSASGWVASYVGTLGNKVVLWKFQKTPTNFPNYMYMHMSTAQTMSS